MWSRGKLNATIGANNKHVEHSVTVMVAKRKKHRATRDVNSRRASKVKLVKPTTRRTTNAKPITKERPKPNDGRGRPKGAKNHVDPKTKASIKAVIEEVTRGYAPDLKTAFIKGIKAFPPYSLGYLKLMAEYTDGKPAETVNVNQPWDLDEIERERRQLAKRFNTALEKILPNIDALLKAKPNADQ